MSLNVTRDEFAGCIQRAFAQLEARDPQQAQWFLDQFQAIHDDLDIMYTKELKKDLEAHAKFQRLWNKTREG